jgi:transcriptional regulator with GAF, ATPase, and Fis domain
LPTLEAAENSQAKRLILKVLELTGWRIRGAGGAAEILGLKPTTLEARMKKLGVRRPV